jgi:hypothetical protein
MMIVAFRVLIGGEGGRGAETVVAATISPGSVSEAVVVAILIVRRPSLMYVLNASLAF